MSDPLLTPESMPTDPISRRLFILVCLIVIFVASLLIFGLAIQWRAYAAGLNAAAPQAGNHLSTGDVDHAAVITYARGLGAAVNKTSALFLGFMLVFTGALYVLRSAQAAFSLSATKGEMSGVLETTSPGLVIVTLGVILTMATIMTKSDLDYERSVPEAPDIMQQGTDVTPIPPIPNAPMKPLSQENK